MNKEQEVDKLDSIEKGTFDAFWREHNLENVQVPSKWVSLIDNNEKWFYYTVQKHGDIVKTIMISGTRISKIELESSGSIIFSENFDETEEVTINPEILLNSIQYMTVRLKIYAESVNDINALYLFLHINDRQKLVQNEITHNNLTYKAGCVKVSL